MRALVPRLTLLLISLPGAALAGGFAVDEQDAAATGRAGTATAALMGASSVHYNPAHLSRIFAIDAAAGATGILPTAAAIDPETGSAQSADPVVRLPPHVYGAYGNGKWGVGAGFNAPFGGGLHWGDDFRGRFEIIEQKLQVLAAHGGFGYQLLPQLSLGGTVHLYRASLAVERRVDFVSREGTALLQGTGVGIGGSLGLSYAPSEHLRFGLTGRLPSRISLKGQAHFEDVPAAFHETLPLPGRAALGMALYFDGVRLFADVDYTMWSAFERSAVDFAPEGSSDTVQPRHWRNAFGVRLGAERDLNARATVRAGLLFDQKTSPADTLSPSLPDSDRVGGSLGLGYDQGPVRGDLSYMFVLFTPRSAEGEAFSAHDRAAAHLLALTVRLGTPPGIARRRADTSDHRPIEVPVLPPPLTGSGMEAPAP